MPSGQYVHTHSYERSEQHRASLADHMLRIRLDPDDPRMKDATHRAGVISTAQRWVCAECGLISHAAGVGRHQQCAGHSGRSRIDNQESA